MSYNSRFQGSIQIAIQVVMDIVVLDCFLLIKRCLDQLNLVVWYSMDIVVLDCFLLVKLCLDQLNLVVWYSLNM